MNRCRPINPAPEAGGLNAEEIEQQQEWIATTRQAKLQERKKELEKQNDKLKSKVQ